MSEFVDPIDYALAADPNGPPLLRGEAIDRLGVDVLESIAEDAEYDDDDDDDDDDSATDVDDPSELDTTPAAEHVVMHQTKAGTAGAKCLNCGEAFVAELPVKLDNWIAHIRTFVSIHKNCKAKVEAKKKKNG